MQSINLWESTENDNYIFFSNIEDFFEYFDKNNIDFSKFDFYTKERFKPGDKGETLLDNKVVRNNIEMVYTDSKHPIAFAIKNEIIHYSMVNPTFFEEHKEEFKKYALKKFKEYLQTKPVKIRIPSYIFSIDLLNMIVNDDEYKDIKFTLSERAEQLDLSKEERQIIKENHLSFIKENKHSKNEIISTNCIIYSYTIKQLQSMKTIDIIIPTTDETINNLIYLNDNATIHFKVNTSLPSDELTFFNELNNIFKTLAKLKKNFNISINVENRSLLAKSNLLNNIPTNINLIIVNDKYNYDIETYKKEENKLEALAKPIRESNLSPLEKYLAIYDIVKNFKPYKENEDDKEQSRRLRYILDKNNEYIVCAGYSRLLNELLKRVGISVTPIDASVDVSRNKGFNEQKDNRIELHKRNLIRIDDEKYNVHGYYIADSTWDNNAENNLYLNSIITFDRKKEATKLETLKKQDLLFDFHNLEEFSAKIKYYLKKEIKAQKKYNTTYRKAVYAAYKNLYKDIMAFLKELDYEKYREFFDKYNNNIVNSPAMIEEEINEMLSEYASYILPLSNNKISLETIIMAAANVKRELYHFDDKQLKEWLQSTKNDNEKYDKRFFPYKYDPNNPTEAYVEEYEEGEISKHR